MLIVLSCVSGRRASECHPSSAREQAGHGGLPHGGRGAPGVGAGRTAGPHLPDIQDQRRARRGAGPGHGLAV